MHYRLMRKTTLFFISLSFATIACAAPRTPQAMVQAAQKPRSTALMARKPRQ